MELNPRPPLSVVVSAYLPRGVEAATVLAFKLRAFVREVFLVINSDEAQRPVKLREEAVTIVVRPNVGMNIGAWAYGASLSNRKNHLLCLQDECSLHDSSFAQTYSDLLEDPTIGLVGESLNPKWDMTWAEISQSPLNYLVSGPTPRKRVDMYLDQMGAWGIDPGQSGRHLRALVWGFNRTVVDEFAKIQLGVTKEQCIASEIAVSKLVQNNLGLKVLQSSQRPFRYFGHSEWENHGLSKKQIHR